MLSSRQPLDYVDQLLQNQRREHSCHLCKRVELSSSHTFSQAGLEIVTDSAWLSPRKEAGGLHEPCPLQVSTGIHVFAETAAQL